MPISLYQTIAANNLPVGASFMDKTAGATYLVAVLQDLKATIRQQSLNYPWISLLGLQSTAWTGSLAWTFVSSTTASIQGDQSTDTMGTGYLAVGQQVRAFVTGPPSTAYGTITAVTVASNITTITVEWASGQFDSGLSDVQTFGTIAIPVASAGWNSVGLVGTTSSTTSASVTAKIINCWNPATGGVIAVQNFSGSCATTLAGPVVNGRDQSGAFTNGQIVYFYAIAGSGVAGMIVSSSGPLTGPTLPTNYTNWAYLYSAVLASGTTNLPTPLYLNGNTVMYNTGQAALSTGTATSYTSVPYTNWVPTDAQDALLYVYSLVSTTSTNGGTLSFSTQISLDGTNELLGLPITVNWQNNAYAQSDVRLMQITVPNLGAVQYLISVTGSTGSIASHGANVQVIGYTVPNNAS